MSVDLSHNIADLHAFCLKQNIPFAAYRLPLDSKIQTIIQTTPNIQKIVSLEKLYQQSGFLVAPFDEKQNASFLLKADIHLKGNNFDKALLSDLKSVTTSILKKAEAIQETKKEDFIQQVEEAKKAISNGKCSKIVLSKIRIQDKKEAFDASKLYVDLCNLYPHAFISFIFIPEVGCWIGASPEPLLEILEESVHTVSLAGTQKAINLDKKDAVWSKKEVNEQAIVTNYIEDILFELKLHKHKLQGPFTYLAGNLMHLKTSFSFSKNELGNRWGELISSLHPTPSVCGLPKVESLDLIQKLEKHPRSYYSGYLGPLNIEEETHLFVNLRCLEVRDDKIVLYSGAGITEGSKAEKEWDETEEKLKTLLQVIK